MAWKLCYEEQLREPWMFSKKKKERKKEKEEKYLYV